MNGSVKETADGEKQGDAEIGRVRSKSLPRGDKKSLRFEPAEDEVAGNRTRNPCERTDDYALPLGQAPPYEFSEGKWLRSDFPTGKLSPSCLDNLPDGALVERTAPTGAPSRSSPSYSSPSGGEISPFTVEESQSVGSLSEGWTSALLKLRQEFVPLLCARETTVDAPESGQLPAVPAAPVGVRSSGTFSVQEGVRGAEAPVPREKRRRPAVAIFDDSSDRSGGSPRASRGDVPAHESAVQAKLRVAEQDTMGGSYRGDTTEMMYSTARDKIITESMIDQPGSRALHSPGYSSQHELSVPVFTGSFKVVSAQTDKERAYANYGENERHDMVARRLRAIPMRLFMVDLFLAFFFVVTMHYALLSRMRQERETSVAGPTPRGLPVCRSVMCKAAGTQLFYSLNLSARPCDSIYDVVCRPWVHASPAMYRRVVLGADRLLVDNMHTDVKRALVSHRRSLSGRTSLDKLQRLYLLCTNAELRDKWGLVTFQELMRRYGFDGWPFRSQHGNLVRDLALFVHDTGADVFFRLTSTPDGAEADVLTIECPSLGLPAESFTANTSDVQVYRTYISDLLQRASGRVDVGDTAAEILEFETRLAHLVVAHCRGDKPYTTRAIDNSTSSHDFDARMFLTIAVALHQQLQRSRIRLQSPDYFDGVTEIMLKHAASGTYFGWRVAAKLLPLTTTAIAGLHHQFQAELGVEHTTTARQCLESANDVMPLAMGRAFISEYSRKASSFEAYRLILRLVQSLDREVYTDSWFDSETHGTYTNLRATMTTLFGYPPGLTSDAMLDAYYEPVRDSQSFLAMYVSAATVTFQNSFDSSSALSLDGRERFIFLGAASQWTERRSPRPFYDVRRNAFILPSGILRPPYYEDDAVPALNFGGLGFIVAYDLLRGLLSNSTDTFWGRVVAKTNITDRYRCLESRIAADFPAVQPRGLAMVALAVRLAFLAYHQREDLTDDETLSGLVDMTPDQLFFVSVARTLCSVVRDEHYVKVVLQKTSGGPLGQVDAALMWLPEFGDAFNCSKTAPHREVTLTKEGC